MILRTLLRLIGEVAAWTALVVVISTALMTAAGLVSARIAQVPRRLIIGMTIGGALVAAGLSHRLGLPELFVIDIGRRPLPVAWVVAGSVLGIAAAWLVRRRSQA
ncbi:MAG: hypothetical protein Q8Q29_06825 [Actinomycetota bacterium]|jgi:hypothetical protein|nr:hypothetical protein [Actinomycetota bacterium]